jgi:hypothetical protein
MSITYTEYLKLLCRICPVHQSDKISTRQTFPPQNKAMNNTSVAGRVTASDLHTSEVGITANGSS